MTRASIKAFISAFIKAGKNIEGGNVNPADLVDNILTELDFNILTEDGSFILKEAA
jgi:hypothetical protein